MEKKAKSAGEPEISEDGMDLGLVQKEWADLDVRCLERGEFWGLGAGDAEEIAHWVQEVELELEEAVGDAEGLLAELLVWDDVNGGRLELEDVKKARKRSSLWTKGGYGWRWKYLSVGIGPEKAQWVSGGWIPIEGRRNNRM